MADIFSDFFVSLRILLRLKAEHGLEEFSNEAEPFTTDVSGIVDVRPNQRSLKLLNCPDYTNGSLHDELCTQTHRSAKPALSEVDLKAAEVAG